MLSRLVFFVTLTKAAASLIQQFKSFFTEQIIRCFNKSWYLGVFLSHYVQSMASLFPLLIFIVNGAALLMQYFILPVLSKWWLMVLYSFRYTSFLTCAICQCQRFNFMWFFRICFVCLMPGKACIIFSHYIAMPKGVLYGTVTLHFCFPKFKSLKSNLHFCKIFFTLQPFILECSRSYIFALRTSI